MEGVAAMQAPIANDDELMPASFSGAAAIETETGIFFELAEIQTVATGNNRQTFRISTHEIPAQYRHYAAPKVSRDVYLLARVYDWGKLNLIAGKARIFYDNTYVGETYINPKQTTDTLDLSLGIDPGIAIERTRIKDYSEVKTLNNHKRETLALQIKVRNSRSKEISLLLEDQVPISSNNEIEVELKETTGGIFDEQTGKLSWQFNIKPEETVVKKLTYSVKYPKDRIINL
jgi:uncharacterized protein (TIGR02231 family)